MAGCSGTVYRCSRANRQDGQKCARTMQAEALEKFVEDAAIRLLTGLSVNPRRTQSAAVEAAEREIARRTSCAITRPPRCSIVHQRAPMRKRLGFP